MYVLYLFFCILLRYYLLKQRRLVKQCRNLVTSILFTSLSLCILLAFISTSVELFFLYKHLTMKPTE